MRRVLVVLALLVVAAAAGNGEAAGGTRKEADGKDATDTIRLAPILVSIIVAGKVVGQAGVLVQLQLADPGDFDAVDKARTRLADAFLSELYGLFDQLQDAPVVVDPAIVKEHLARTADRILGAGKIREIVILRSYEKRNPS